MRDGCVLPSGELHATRPQIEIGVQTLRRIALELAAGSDSPHPGNDELLGLSAASTTASPMPTTGVVDEFETLTSIDFAQQLLKVSTSLESAQEDDAQEHLLEASAWVVAATVLEAIDLLESQKTNVLQSSFYARLRSLTSGHLRRALHNQLDGADYSGRGRPNAHIERLQVMVEQLKMQLDRAGVDADDSEHGEAGSLESGVRRLIEASARNRQQLPSVRGSVASLEAKLRLLTRARNEMGATEQACLRQESVLVADSMSLLRERHGIYAVDHEAQRESTKMAVEDEARADSAAAVAGQLVVAEKPKQQQKETRDARRRANEELMTRRDELRAQLAAAQASSAPTDPTSDSHSAVKGGGGQQSPPPPPPLVVTPVLVSRVRSAHASVEAMRSCLPPKDPELLLAAVPRELREATSASESASSLRGSAVAVAERGEEATTQARAATVAAATTTTNCKAVACASALNESLMDLKHVVTERLDAVWMVQRGGGAEMDGDEEEMHLRAELDRLREEVDAVNASVEGGSRHSAATPYQPIARCAAIAAPEDRRSAPEVMKAGFAESGMDEDGTGHSEIAAASLRRAAAALSDVETA